jgi:hypothetical protein
MIIYKWKALPVGEVTGLDTFSTNLFTFENYGLTYQQIKRDIDQKLLFPYSYEKILANAIDLNANSSFPA